MNRAEQAEKTTKALYGGASALGVTDPEFAAIKERLIYGEVYAEEKLSARLRELVILVVATTNQTMNEVKRHTAAALACGVKPEEIKEAVYHCAPYIGLGKAENAVNAVNAVFAEKGIVLPLTSGQTVTEESRLLDGIAAQKSIFGDHIDAMRAAAPENQKNIQDYGVFVKQAAGSAGNAMPIQRKTDGRDNCKWRNEGHPVTAWYASVTMVAGKGVLWSDTRKTATRSSTMYPRRRKRL